jgi:SAM-dependent methyltransferase
VGKQAKQRKARRQGAAARESARGDTGAGSTGDDSDGAGGDRELLGALDLLARRRAPYDQLLASVVAETLQRFPFAIDGGARRVLELGAGTGQLGAWLPPEVAARAVPSDVAPGALAELRRRAKAPSAPALAARAQQLPITGGALAGVAGLCVFDAIHAGGGETAAAVEIARVLAPGGRFVHLLDMATLLDTPFTKLAGSGLVPIPNVFGDPSEHAWPLDVLLLRRDWTAGLLQLAARARHPLARDFAGFFDAFMASPFDAGRALPLFHQLAADGARRFALSSQIASACRLAVDAGYSTLQPMPFHSGRYLASVIEAAFKDTGAFQIEASEVVTRSVWRAATRADGNITYRSLALGHERVLPELPATLLDETARADAAPGQVLTEVGVYTFIATRVQ